MVSLSLYLQVLQSSRMTVFLFYGQAPVSSTQAQNLNYNSKKIAISSEISSAAFQMRKQEQIRRTKYSQNEPLSLCSTQNTKGWEIAAFHHCQKQQTKICRVGLITQEINENICFMLVQKLKETRQKPLSKVPAGFKTELLSQL